jgi:indolepyruvate ferredoxin oxidoreductase, beta subunit
MGENRVFNILIVGVGGQGIILSSDIIANAAMQQGFDAKKSEIHGMSQRGGSVFSHIRFGEKVYSPVIPLEKTDILVSFEEMETLRWIEYVNKDTKILFSENKILPAEQKVYPEGIKSELKRNFKNSFEINQEELIKIIGKPKYLNTAILGMTSNFIDFTREAWEKAIEEEVPSGTYKENYEAFNKGKSFLKI